GAALAVPDRQEGGGRACAWPHGGQQPGNCPAGCRAGTRYHLAADAVRPRGGQAWGSGTRAPEILATSGTCAARLPLGASPRAAGAGGDRAARGAPQGIALSTAHRWARRSPHPWPGALCPAGQHRGPAALRSKRRGYIRPGGRAVSATANRAGCEDSLPWRGPRWPDLGHGQRDHQADDAPEDDLSDLAEALLDAGELRAMGELAGDDDGGSDRRLPPHHR